MPATARIGRRGLLAREETSEKITENEHYRHWNSPRPAGPQSFRHWLRNPAGDDSHHESYNARRRHPAVPVHRRSFPWRLNQEAKFFKGRMVGEKGEV